MTRESEVVAPKPARNAPSQPQREAADPLVSAWVSANAGSGKTTVLTARVIRLLLKGARASGILCLTFTKAAAANMQNKIFERLGEWVALDNDALAAAIEDMTGAAPSATDMTSARRLFARAVETPGGLKVQTIHSFCEKLLHQAPFEAGVPAHFEVMEDVDAEALLAEAISGTMRSALKMPDGALRRALHLVSLEAGEDAAQVALRKFITLQRKHKGPERKFANLGLSEHLAITRDDSVTDVEAELRDGSLYQGNWQEIRDWLAASEGKQDRDKAGWLAAAFRKDGGHEIATYVPIFLKAGMQKRADASFIGKASRLARPDFLDAVDAERERVFALMDRQRRVAMRNRTEAIQLLAEDAFGRYNAAKRRVGQMDFGDLIEKAVALLQSPAAGWVLYKLDQGIDHILVDEAQDTSPEQWQIVKAIAGDFFDGHGARGSVLRTLFAVGDEKQSIYGFQGARPQEFADAERHFQSVIAAHNREADRPHALKNIKLRTSYRTGPDILSGVDTVFSRPETYAGLDSDNKAPQHDSNRPRDAGLIELWEPIVAEKTEEPNPEDPVDALPADNPFTQIAKRIAGTIQHWQKNDERFADDGKPITPGDILILVRNRGPIFEAVIRALKQAELPVAGADRLKLFSNIAIKDLLALGQVCLLPEDDLTLASLLKSPLCGLDDKALERIAAERGEISLWTSLARDAETDAALAVILANLERWRHRARTSTPLEFYRDVLSADRGRAQLVQRLGPDAEDAITAFLAMLRTWQERHVASLALFLAHVAADERDVRRDMDEAHGRIRVMTAHGAKGLEARVVFLADTMHAMEGRGEPNLMLAADTPESVVWAPRSGDDPQLAEQAREANKLDRLAESRRLLYVALTRAKDRLYIAGAKGQKAVTNTWYQLVREALEQAQDHSRKLTEIVDATGNTVWRWQDISLPVKPPVDVSKTERQISLPDWLHIPAPQDLPRPPPIRPSRLIDAAEPPAMERVSSRRMEARQRGEAVHLLLQHLVGADTKQRLPAAKRLLEARFPALPAPLRQQAIDDAVHLIETPELAAVFASDGRNEPAIAGEIEIGGKRLEVAGRIDRIAILPDAILMVDYKTGYPPKSGDIPESYLRQLAVYRALLADLYPDKPIKAAIIWTMAARADLIDAAKMDDALATLSSPLT